MTAASNSVATGNPDNFIDAVLAMSNAKMSAGIAVKLSQTQDEITASTLDMFA